MPDVPKFMSLLGTADSGMGRACQSLKVPGMRLNLYPGTPPTTRLLVTLHPLYAGEPNDHYDGRPSSPTWLPFATMQGEGCLLLPISSPGILLCTPPSNSREYFCPIRGH